MATDIKSADSSEVLTICKVLSNRTMQIVLLISVAILMAVYWRVFHWWWGLWMEKESYYSHAILIPFMSAFVVYMNRASIAKVQIKPSLLGLAVLIPVIFLHFLAYIGNTASIMGICFPIVIMGMSLLIFGVAMTWHLFFPISFLSFMCVLPGFVLSRLSFKIQLLSTDIAARLLDVVDKLLPFVSFSVVQKGTMINMSHIEVFVGTPCSGFRMLISLLAFSIYFAYMKEGPLWGRLTIVAMTAPLSLVANSLRIALIAVWGQYFGGAAMMKFHDYSGYFVLLVAFVVLWWFAKVVKCEKFKSTLFS